MQCSRYGINSVKVTAIVLVMLCPDIPAAIEVDGGADVRQNALLMSSPLEMDTALSPEGSFGISETRLRFRSSAYYGGFVLNCALESRAGFISSDSGMLSLSEGGGSIFGKSRPLEHWDLTWEHIEEQSTSLSSRIERLDVRWKAWNVDFDIGRQPVSLGTSHFIGVLDVLAPFAPGDLDATYKPGIDAVRIRKGLGMTGEAEIIAAGAKNFSDGAVLGRYRTMVQGIDFEFIGGRFRRRGFGGFGWEGEIKEMGIWGEMALFERKENLEKWRGGWSRAAFSGAAGIDVNLPAEFKIGSSFMFQDFGVREPEELEEIYRDAPFRENWVFLASAAYCIVTVNRELHPLVRSDLAGMINLIDNSTLWQPRITINTGDTTDLCFYGWIGTGKKPRVSGSSGTIRSEFGMFPDGGGFYARWFF